jgi:hypothetical protein
MPDRTVTTLLWAFPAALSLHVFEEFALPGGFKQWIKTHKPRRLKSDRYYVAVNAAAIVGAAIIALTAAGMLGFRMYLYSVGIMAGNAASHLRGMIQAKQYCPGVVSGCLLLIPLLAAGYWYLPGRGRVDWPSAILCSCIGLAIGFYVFCVDIRKIDRA